MSPYSSTKYVSKRPDHITQWCDNKAAVDRSNTGLLYPGVMLYTDADIILLAISHAQKELGNYTSMVCRHVYGHQDLRQTQAGGQTNVGRRGQ